MIPDSISSFTNKDVCLKKFNSWKVGGKAKYLSLPKTVQEAKGALVWAKSEKLRFLAAEVMFL
jgi:UDP-N-acetylenolpyruvoylglucosamine reductase